MVAALIFHYTTLLSRTRLTLPVVEPFHPLLPLACSRLYDRRHCQARPLLLSGHYLSFVRRLLANRAIPREKRDCNDYQESAYHFYLFGHMLLLFKPLQGCYALFVGQRIQDVAALSPPASHLCNGEVKISKMCGRVSI